MNGAHQFLLSIGFKSTTTPYEYLADCLKCGKQDKLAFNAKKLIGHCWSCNAVFSLKDLIVAQGLHLDYKHLLSQLERLQQQAEVSELGFRDAVLSKLLGNFVEVPEQVPLPEAPLPEGFALLSENQDSISGGEALAYLLGRGFKKKVLFDMGFGFCAIGYYSGRVIIPFYEKGKLVYWQARDYTGKVPKSKKVLNPQKWNLTTGKSEVIFNYDNLSKWDVVVVCESWGSALAVGPMACGLSGKTLSDTQFHKLKALKKATSFMVLLDYGAEKEAWKVAERLNSISYTTVASLPWGDPNEVSRQELLLAISKAVPYSKLAYIRSLSCAL